MVAQRQRVASLLGGVRQLRARARQNAIQLKAESDAAEPNQTGLPDQLKAGLESLSGMDMSAVRVHRNSPKPAQLSALAYAQGNNIHLGPGQEQHLPHEAWHVVQQRQGRVTATMQMAGMALNDNVGLEREADLMGGSAVLQGAAMKRNSDAHGPPTLAANQRLSRSPANSGAPIQAKFTDAEIRRIAMLSMRRRIDLLARVSQEDLESWYDSPEFGSMYLGAEESDEIRERRTASRDDADIDALVDAMAGLSLDDDVASLPDVAIERQNYDADGDVRMRDIDGGVDVEMTDVHGTMDVEIADVEGTVEMDIDAVNADVHMSIEDVDGYVHVSLMNIDLTPPAESPDGVQASRGVLRLGIRGVQGVLDLQIWHSTEPMDISIDTVAKDEHLIRRVNKRKRAPDDPPAPEEEERRKRARPEPSSAGPPSGTDAEVEALTEGLSALDIREPFYAQMDSAVHELYPAADLSDLIVHSDPVPLETVITSKRWQGSKVGGNAIKALKKLAAIAQTALKAMSSPTKTKAQALRKAMKEIAKELGKIKNVPLPKTVLSGINHPSNSGNTEGKKATADPLSLSSSTAGSAPTNDSRLMDAIRGVATPLGENKSYKMMHLLNHKVFGPGELWNMTPGPAASNVQMERDIETPLKRAIHDKGLVIGFEAVVDYKADPMVQSQPELNRNPDGYRFKKIDFTAWEYELDAAGNAFSQVSTSPDADVTAINGSRVTWDYGGLTVLREKPRLLDPSTTEQDLRDAGLTAVAKKIWQFNQDVAAGKVAAFVVPKGDKKAALMTHIKTVNNDSRKAPDNWNANAVNWS